MTASRFPGVAELPGLLDELERRWRDNRIPLVGWLRPGLTDAQMRELLDPLGIEMPEEGRIWWGRHDGPPDANTLTAAISPWAQYLSLDLAVSEYLQYRETLRRLGRALEEDVDRTWHPGWLPLATTRGRPIIAIDCAVPAGAPSPVYVVAWGDDENSDKPKAPSLAQAVVWWIRGWDERWWWFDHEKNQWAGDPDRMPRELAVTGLV